MDARQVVASVHEALRRLPSEEYRLHIIAGEVRLDNDWWYVPVQPQAEPQKRSPYYEYLAEIEGILQDEHGLNILLVPVLAESHT